MMAGAALHQHSPRLVYRELERLRSLAFPISSAAYLHSNRAYLGDAAVKQYSSALNAYVLKRAYWNDWLPYRYHLQGAIGRFLDIGGGLGVFSLLAAVLGRAARVTLIEKAERDAEGEVFPMAKLFEDLMRANRVGNARFVEAGEGFVSRVGSETYTHICSFRALGFLFPYDWYREFILDRLETGGTLLLDVRKAGFLERQDNSVRGRFNSEDPSELLRLLKGDFGSVKTLGEGSASIRLLASR